MSEEEITRLRIELIALRVAAAESAHEIEQVLGKALGYPKLYPEASQCNDGTVCVGDHTPESLAEEAAKEIGRLRAALGRAVEALEATRCARSECEQCDYNCRDDCENTAFWRYQAKADELTPAVLSDPTGQQAYAEWQAMVEVAEAAEEMSNALIQLEHADPQEGALFEWAGKVEAKFHYVLQRWQEVQKDA